MKYLLTLLTLFTGTLSGQTAIWDFSYSGGSTSASGTFTTTVMNGQNIVTGITGEWNGVAISGLLAPGAYYNDNVLSPSAPYVDVSGISFYTADSHNVNLWYGGDSPSQEEAVGPSGNSGEVDSLTAVTLNVSPQSNNAPWEPSDVITAVGVLAFGAVQVRRRLHVVKRVSAQIAGAE